MSGKVTAIIQARMGSTRLPGKVLADIAGRPMLWHVVDRVRRAALIQEVVIATSREPGDDAVAAFCSGHGIPCFRGDEKDVLDRTYRAAKEHGAGTIVRVTADCPLIDAEVIDKVIRKYQENGYDYVTNTFRYTYPDGLDAEVFSFAALETAWREATSPLEREHVTPFLRTSERFRRGSVENDVDLSKRQLRWTVDEPVDLEFIRGVFKRLGQEKPFGLNQILDLLQSEPELAKMNQKHIRNEGYYQSLAKEPPLPPQAGRRLDRSLALKKKAEKLIPSCSQTFSKAPTQFIQGVAPVFLSHGRGSHVWDVDGNEYIDYPLALGPIILGYNDPDVSAAVARQLEKATILSLPHPLEVEVAELLTEVIPCAEMVRFGKNGSDVTAGAVRAARAFTGRDVIACCGYHGWQDWYIGTTTRNKGIPEAVRKLTLPFAYNDIASLEKIFAENPGRVAAVIMEPVGVVEPEPGFLQQVKDLAHREGALLIFDEIVTGFRLSLGGAQEHFGVTPDLACFGKAMANGFPVSAVVGRRDVMELFDEIFFSFTFGGEMLSLAAALATIKVLREKNVIGHLWEQGQKLKDGYNVLARTFGVSNVTECIGLPPRTVFSFKDENGNDSLERKSLFQQECLKRGILFSGGQNLCMAHSQADIDHTLKVYRTSLEILAGAVREGSVTRRLEGKPVEPVFRRA